jgi:galactoside O-acetyltransferase
LEGDGSYYSHEELLSLGLTDCGEDVHVSRLASLHGADRIALGDHVRVDDFVVLSAGSEGRIDVGRNVHIAAHAALFGGGGIRLGDFASISGRSSLYSASDDYGGDFLVNPTIPERFTSISSRPIALERHALLGAGTIVLPGATVGEGVATGAMTLVTHDLAPWTIYVGAPARPLRPRSRRLLELEKVMLIEEEAEG